MKSLETDSLFGDGRHSVVLTGKPGGLVPKVDPCGVQSSPSQATARVDPCGSPTQAVVKVDPGGSRINAVVKVDPCGAPVQAVAEVDSGGASPTTRSLGDW